MYTYDVEHVFYIYNYINFAEHESGIMEQPPISTIHQTQQEHSIECTA